jgi:hypothetical protein
MKSLMIAVLVLVPLYAFAQDAKMPAEAKKVIDKYDASVEAAKKVYDAAVAKARDQALKDLKPVQMTETKKGNLDEAMAVKAKIDELTADGPGENLVPVKEPKVSKDNKDFSASIIGTWVGDGSGGPWTFSMSGEELQLAEAEGEKHSIKTTFTKDGKILFDWSRSNAVFVVERLGGKRLKITFYSSSEMTKTYGTQTLTRK